MLDLLRTAATAVQDAIATVPQERWREQVGMGADGSPTALVDRVAEEAVLRTLEAEDATFNVVSEEAPYLDRGSPWTLVMDPVDGTANAMAGVPIYSVSLALCKDDLQGAAYGVVRDLVSGWSYEAERGRGAWRNGERIRVRPYDPERSLFTVYLGSNAHPRAFELAARCRRLRNLGAASLDMCLVAAGAADLYYMNSVATDLELRITDVAASSLILREAGGEVYDLGGNALNMALDARQRSNLVALGDPALREVVL